MMKALTTTAITEKPRRTEEMMFRNWSKSLWSSAILVAAVTTSNSAPANTASWFCWSSGRVERKARNSAVAMSRRSRIAVITATSFASSTRAMAISSYTPTLLATSWAVSSSNALMLAPMFLFSSGSPKLAVPTRTNWRLPIGALTVYVLPMVNPYSSAVMLSSMNSPTMSGSDIDSVRSGALPSVMKSWLRSSNTFP